MTKTKLTAIRLTIEAIGVLIAAIFLVAHYEAQIEAINWRLVSLICVVALAIFGLYRWQTQPVQENPYDVLGMFMKDGKADLDAHLKIASFGLASWVLVQQALARAEVTALALGILGFFVVGKAVGGFSDAMARRGPSVSSDVNILAGASVHPAAPSDEAVPKQSAAERIAIERAAPERSQYHDKQT